MPICVKEETQRPKSGGPLLNYVEKKEVFFSCCLALNSVKLIVFPWKIHKIGHFLENAQNPQFSLKNAQNLLDDFAKMVVFLR